MNNRIEDLKLRAGLKIFLAEKDPREKDIPEEDAVEKESGKKLPRAERRKLAREKRKKKNEVDKSK